MKGKTPGLLYVKFFNTGRNLEGFDHEGVQLRNIVDIYSLRKRLYTLKDIEKASFETLLGSHFNEFNFGGDSDLDFHSNFDSGNLFRCIRGEDGIYYLEMAPDTNSAGHERWFHFATSHTKKGERATFRIINFRDKSMLFKNFYYKSKKEEKRKEIGWQLLEVDVMQYLNDDCMDV